MSGLLPLVNPIALIAAPLAAAFLLGLPGLRRPRVAFAITLGVLAFMVWVSAGWLWALATQGAATQEVHTAGVMPPFAINLRMGLAEAALSLLITLAALFSALSLQATVARMGYRALAVLLVLIMAFCGIVLTRDLFNLYVFFELAVIASAGLILLTADQRSLTAGFKYLIVTQLLAVFLLVGTIFIYHATGSLNLDDMAAWGAQGFALAFFLVLIALLGELKPFPANGWALDVYESAHPGFSALFSAAAGAASLFALDKLLLVGGAAWYPVATAVGLTTFIVANILALPQTHDRRLLGYSSVAQTGLILVVLGQRDILGEATPFIAFGLLVAHAVGKAGLYWLSGMVAGRGLTDWAALARRPWLVLAFATFIALLVGLPPFPGFYAKWELMRILAGEGRIALMGLILFGALIKAGYLFRWFGYVLKREPPAAPLTLGVSTGLPVFAALLAAWVLAYVWGELAGTQFGRDNVLLALPLLFALGFLLLDWLPAWVKNTLAIVGLVAIFWLNYADYDPLRLIFGLIFTVGGAITLLASYHVSGRRVGFYPATLLMFAGLVMLIDARDAFVFFAAWEIITLGSYFLILRGRHSEPHALSYMVFSLGGGFLILAAFALAGGGALHLPLTGLTELAARMDPLAPWVFLLLAIGFMTKTAAIGLHIWLPGAHAEAETDVSPLVSGILLKAGLFGLFVLFMSMGVQELYGVNLAHVLLWVGAITALLGNLMAVFQEDAKRLLAYSSIGQMGYALFGLALMNHLGWLMTLMFVINHFIYKSMLFLAVGGVAKRTGTRQMYQMGGLIKLMPLSFIAVLIGIIAMSGVPPLSGFGGRWIAYNALMDSDTRLAVAVLFLAGPIAFLYLFRLIHTIFMGQLKDELRRVREAPFWILLPQMLFVVLLLAFALVPGLALQEVDHYLRAFFPHGGLEWAGLTITSQYGYWSPVAIMVSVGVIFMTVFVWLLFVNRKAQMVKQFNIVFSAERPFRPETTHFAWNFFAPYRKALGFLTQPLVTRFWHTVTDVLHTAGDQGRRLYDGNGQHYAFHFLAFVAIVFLLGF